jgi:hypothetical protein
MTPCAFLDDAARPNVADFHLHIGSSRCAFNAVGVGEPASSSHTAVMQNRPWKDFPDIPHAVPTPFVPSSAEGARPTVVACQPDAHF